MKYGVLATELRKGFADSAIELSQHAEGGQADLAEEGEGVSDRLKSKYRRAEKPAKRSVGLEGFEHGMEFSRRRYRK